MSSKRVYWIEGDGIGPEIWRAARPVIDAALAKESDMRIEWVELLAGEKATAETGSPLPEETMNALRTADFAMKGPLGTPVGTGIRSLNVALRQTLDLYACIRPVRHFEGLETPVKHPERVNMVIFRENTEDVYAGIEYAAQTPEAKKLIAFLREEFGVTKIREEAAVGIKPMSEFGSKRLVRRALRFALDTGSKSLTLVHKGNIMKFTEGGFRQWGYDVAAQEFGDLTCTEKEPVEGRLVVKDRIADAMFQEALLRPEQYQILATPNLNGDYISDALAAQVGGLGLAPGVNMSDSLAFYEATHGTAPTIAGQDKANPGSVILCGALMLEQMGVPAAAERIRNAMSKAIAGRAVTVDLAAQVEGARVVGCLQAGASLHYLRMSGRKGHPCGKGPSSLCFPPRDRGRPTGTTHGLIGKPAPLHPAGGPAGHAARPGFCPHRPNVPGGGAQLRSGRGLRRGAGHHGPHLGRHAGHQRGHRPVRHPVHAFALCGGRLSVLDGHPCPAGRA